MKTRPCLLIQEEIAWGRTLRPESQLHVLSCSECTQISLEFSKLDSAFQVSDTSVPEDFADRVMNQIRLEKNVETKIGAKIFISGDGFSIFLHKLGNLFQLRPVQVTVAIWLAFSMGRAF